MTREQFESLLKLYQLQVEHMGRVTVMLGRIW